MVVVEVAGSKYFMHPGLKNRWDKIKDGKLTIADEDRAYVTDGRERCGKSLFTIQQISYIDPTILNDEKDGETLPPIPLGNITSWETDSPWKREAIRRWKEGTLLPRITFTARTTLSSIRKTRSDKKNTKGILFDEAFRGMSSKGSLSKENKQLVQALMEMGQSNLVLWIASPSFFLLELYPAILRTNALFHVKKDKKSKRRIVCVYNYKKKAILYQIGVRKGWGYPIKTKQKTNFFNIYPGGKDFEYRYRLKKHLELQEMDKEPEKEEHKWKKQRDAAIRMLQSETNLTQMQISNKFKAVGYPISQAMIADIVGKKVENPEV